MEHGLQVAVMAGNDMAPCGPPPTRHYRAQIAPVQCWHRVWLCRRPEIVKNPFRVHNRRSWHAHQGQLLQTFAPVQCHDVLIDRINPFDAAYAVLAKAMDEKSLRQVQAAIAAKKVSLTEEEARDLSKRALQFKNERGRLPDINSADAWEKRMAEGVAAFARYRALAKSAQAHGAQSNG